MKRSLLLLVTLGFVVGCSSAKPVPLGGIGGTSWQLVKFQGGNGTVLTPDDKAKYTVAFAADGNVKVRFDCNRGRGTWILTGPDQLRFGPLALTRTICSPGSLHDHLTKQWPYVGAYTLRGGRLFLSLMADGGTYELEPTP
jgi:para-nitrobenzyl esterase